MTTKRTMTTKRDKFLEQIVAQAHNSDLEVDVVSEGPITSEIAIIGEGPGESEVRQGRPWIGGAGALLWDSVRKFGLHRANVYATNVVKRQISLSRRGNERHAVDRDELNRWISIAIWELSKLPNCRIIFALGNFALEALLGHQDVTKWRGSVLDLKLPNGKVGKIVCSINPAYAKREPKMEPMFLMDCHKLSMVYKGTFKEHKVEATINPTAPQAMKFLSDLRKAKKPIAYDIEFLNLETACHGLSNNPHSAMCINLRDLSTNRYTLTEEADILLSLQDLFNRCESHWPTRTRSALRIIAQNGQFDAYWTRLHDYLRVPIWFDTLLAHHTLYPQLPHGLDFLVSQYTTHPYYKDEREKWREGGDIDKYWEYNCKDAALTVAVSLRLQRELEEQNLADFYFKHVMRAQPHLCEATAHGLAVDLPMKKKVTEEVSEDVGKLRAEFHRHVQELTDDAEYYPNPDSWQQLQVLFFDKLGLRGRGRSTDKANRVKMIENASTASQAKEMLTTLGRYKEESKFLSTYAESDVSDDGRMRCEYRQFGVSRAPGRLSSGQLLSGEGINLQNQPKRARAMYVADPGCVFIDFDLAQAEARVVAWRADIPKWKEQFEQARVDGKYDCHRALAADMFRMEYKLVPAMDFDPHTNKHTIRYVAKRCRHGLNYRMERWKLAEVTGLPYHEAGRVFALYHGATPELRRWWGQEEREFRRTKVLYNALGRRLKVIQRIDDDVLSSIIACYPQSTIGDKVTQVWYQAEEDDAWPDLMHARVALNVHDNLVGITTPKYAKGCLRILKRYAESKIMVQDAWKRGIEPLIIPAECKISVADKKGVHRWSNLKDVEL